MWSKATNLSFQSAAFCYQQALVLGRGVSLKHKNSSPWSHGLKPCPCLRPQRSRIQ